MAPFHSRRTLAQFEITSPDSEPGFTSRSSIESGEVPRGEKMLDSGTDPESYITEYTLVYEDKTADISLTRSAAAGQMEHTSAWPTNNATQMVDNHWSPKRGSAEPVEDVFIMPVQPRMARNSAKASKVASGSLVMHDSG